MTTHPFWWHKSKALSVLNNLPLDLRNECIAIATAHLPTGAAKQARITARNYPEKLPHKPEAIANATRHLATIRRDFKERFQEVIDLLNK